MSRSRILIPPTTKPHWEAFPDPISILPLDYFDTKLQNVYIEWKNDKRSKGTSANVAHGEFLVCRVDVEWSIHALSQSGKSKCDEGAIRICEPRSFPPRTEHCKGFITQIATGSPGQYKYTVTFTHVLGTEKERQAKWLEQESKDLLSVLKEGEMLMLSSFQTRVDRCVSRVESCALFEAPVNKVGWMLNYLVKKGVLRKENDRWGLKEDKPVKQSCSTQKLNYFALLDDEEEDSPPQQQLQVTPQSKQTVRWADMSDDDEENYYSFVTRLNTLE